MDSYLIEMELQSEAIFGNGQSSTSFVDVEIQKDEYGLPFLKGKTFKGKLREEAAEIEKLLFNDDKIVSSLFGTEFSSSSALLRFSDCTVSEKVRNNLAYGIKNKTITPYDITEALTEVRSFTKLDENGIAEDSSLRQARVVKKGLKLYCTVNTLRQLNKNEEGILACSIRSLRNLGMMESRGKGHVVCRLIKDNSDITSKCISKLEKGLI